MLVQTPSKILKTDFRIWENFNQAASTSVLSDEEKTGRLQSVKEIVLSENADYHLSCNKECTAVLLPLYGEIIINDYYESVKAGESLTLALSPQSPIHLKKPSQQ